MKLCSTLARHKSSPSRAGASIPVAPILNSKSELTGFQILPRIKQGRIYCTRSRLLLCRSTDGAQIGSCEMTINEENKAEAVTLGTRAATENVPAQLSKNFEFANEDRIYNWWEAEGYFKPVNDCETLPFVISMPPPNVTGALHMGHAIFVTLEDIMVRHWRMRGRPTLWIPGTDHAGIATQLVVEKMLASQGIRRLDLDREAFVEKVWEWKEKYGGTITNQLRKLGASCDWTREHFTLDEQLSRAVIKAFIHLHDKGLIYKGTYMVNWSPNLQTAVSDLEVEYSEEPGELYFIKYPVSDASSDDYLPVATTRPETLLGDTAVAVHPKDARYSKFVGRMATVPMSNGRTIPIIADEYVDKEFGTGALKITPGHDPNDYEISKRVGLPVINILNKDGTLNENGGKYSGLDRFEARKQLWADLEASGLAMKKEPYKLRVPRSQRGGEIVEPLVSEQWFVSMKPLAEQALKAVEDGEIRIIPDRFEKVYMRWLSNIKDWCISRQLWWGHRIPVWYPKLAGAENNYIVAANETEAYKIAHVKFGSSVELIQDPDVLDTWFSSGLWPFSTLGWPDESTNDFKHFYPTTVLETGHDILFFWVARMIMMGIEFTGRPPFSIVYLHGLVRDSQGRKMSKSLGNVVDPVESIREYGTDALRFTLATGNTPGQDLNLSFERLGANKAFTNKLWNAGKFILQNLPEGFCLESSSYMSKVDIDRLRLCERWVITKVHILVDSVTASYEKFDFGEVGRAIYDFFWNDFADWYIEASKTRLYNTKDAILCAAAQSTLVYVFDSVLKLLHPFMPFVTEELWQAMPHEGKALIAAKWPQCNLPKDMQSVHQFEHIQALVRGIRNVRAEYSVEPGRRISAIIIISSDLQDSIEEELNVIVSLAKLDCDQTKILCTSPGEMSNAIHIVVADGFEAYLPLEDMIDVYKEIDRLSKQVNKLQQDYDGHMTRLLSQNFVEKAPPSVVESVKVKANDAMEKLQILQKRLEVLKLMKSTQ